MSERKPFMKNVPYKKYSKRRRLTVKKNNVLRVKLWKYAVNFHRNEEGGTIISLLIAVLCLFLMVGYMTNMAAETIERERIQHVADSFAYSSAIWSARGMNTVSSLNHLMGEKTAYAVVHNALAGPEISFESCSKEREIDSYLNSGDVRSDAPNPKKEQKDDIRNLINDFTDEYYPFENDRKHYAGAAVYDSKVTLKYQLAKALQCKMLGTWLIREGDSDKSLFFCPIAGRIIHEGEDFFLGINSFMNMDSYLNSLDEMPSGEEFQKKIDNSLKQVGGNVSNQSSEMDEIQKDLNVICEELESRFTDFKSHDANESDLNDLSSIMEDAKTNANSSQGSLDSSSKNFGKAGDSLTSSQATSSGKQSLEKGSAQIKTTKESLNKMKKQLEVIKGQTKDLDFDFSEIENKIDGLESKLEGLMSVISEMDEAIGNVSEAIDKLSNVQNLNPQDAIQSAINALGGSSVKSERKTLLELERKIAKPGRNRSHSKRKEIYQDIEHIQKQFAPAVGNSLRKQISATCEELEEIYQLKPKKEDEKSGANYAIAPKTTFLPIVQDVASQLSPPNSIMTAPLPFLPVLAEDEVTLNIGSNYLSECQSQPWRTTNSGPLNQLPQLPWGGSFKRSLAETLHRSFEIAYYVCLAGITAEAAVYLAAQNYVKSADLAALALKLLVKERLASSRVEELGPSKYGYNGNPSVWSYPRQEFDYQKEATSQWVRATRPVADSLCSGLCQEYDSKLQFSNFATYLTAWTYRYTLSESYYLRTGKQRPYRSDDANYVIPSPCYLYVIAGTKAEKKGEEAFWDNPLIMDQMFSVCAVVRSEPHRPVALSTVFRRFGEKDGVMAAAQATYYPYNGRNTSPSSGKLQKQSGIQPLTAWDTLQWKNVKPGDLTTFSAPEWKNGNPHKGPSSWDYDQFCSRRLKTLPSANVELSWEAMLSPVTVTRLAQIAADSKANEAIRRAAKHAAKHPETLCN